MHEKQTLKKFLLIVFDVLAFTGNQWLLVVEFLTQKCHHYSHPCHVKVYKFGSYYLETNNISILGD